MKFLKLCITATLFVTSSALSLRGQLDAAGEEDSQHWSRLMEETEYSLPVASPEPVPGQPTDAPVPAAPEPGTSPPARPTADPGVLPTVPTDPPVPADPPPDSAVSECRTFSQLLNICLLQAVLYRDFSVAGCDICTAAIEENLFAACGDDAEICLTGQTCAGTCGSCTPEFVSWFNCYSFALCPPYSCS